MNPKSQENDRQNPLSCKFRYFKSAETQCKSTVSEFFTGDYLRDNMASAAGRLAVGNAAGAVAVVTAMDKLGDIYDPPIAKMALFLFSVGIIFSVNLHAVFLGFLDFERKWRTQAIRTFLSNPRQPIEFENEPYEQPRWAVAIEALVMCSLSCFVIAIAFGFFALV